MKILITEISWGVDDHIIICMWYSMCGSKWNFTSYYKKHESAIRNESERLDLNLMGNADLFIWSVRNCKVFWSLRRNQNRRGLYTIDNTNGSWRQCQGAMDLKHISIYWDDWTYNYMCLYDTYIDIYMQPCLQKKKYKGTECTPTQNQM